MQKNICDEVIYFSTKCKHQTGYKGFKKNNQQVFQIEVSTKPDKLIVIAYQASHVEEI
ncbi:MAG TPA: hypothetical protein PK419_08750 [Spirochaetota bacterium]|nr:hypothetical protein [Spirochaetota bacterium]